MTVEIKQAEHETEGNKIKSSDSSSSNADSRNECSYITGEPFSLKTIVYIVYLCQALSFLFGITAIVGVIINYLRFDEAKNTWLESHLVWQIRTFWIGLGAAIVGCFFIFIAIGFLILAVNLVWIIYRVIKGFLLLCKNQPIANYAALL